MKVIWRLLMGTEAATSTSLGGGTSVCGVGVGRQNAKRRRFDARDVISSGLTGLTRGARSTFADNGWTFLAGSSASRKNRAPGELVARLTLRLSQSL